MSLKLIIWLLNKEGKNIYFRKGRKPRELVQKFLYPRTKVRELIDSLLEPEWGLRKTYML